jgi:hypothetical protein
MERLFKMTVNFGPYTTQIKEITLYDLATRISKLEEIVDGFEKIKEKNDLRATNSQIINDK